MKKYRLPTDVYMLDDSAVEAVESQDLKETCDTAESETSDMDGRAWISTYDSMISSIGCSSSRLGGKNWINTTARDKEKTDDMCHPFLLVHG